MSRARGAKIVRMAVAALLALAVVLVPAFVPMRKLLPAAVLPARAEGELRVHFLGIGQGDCTIVEFPDGDALVVDAGDGSFEHNNFLIRYLKGLRAQGLILVVTHADVDHYGGMEEIVHVFGAEQAYLPAIGTQASAYQSLAETLERSGCSVGTLKRYDAIERPSGAYAVCISPHAVGESDANEASAVLYLSYQDVNFMLCADISAEREAQLLREAALYDGIFDSGALRVRPEETDILKTAHHGSANSSSEVWLQTLSPEVAVLSSGRGNAYRHPAAETLARLRQAGAEIYRTDEYASVVVSVMDGAYTVLTLTEEQL